MNRQQLRNSIKKGDFITLTEHEQRMRNFGVQLLRRAVNDYSAAVCLATRDELKFGRKRATRFLKKVNELFEDIERGRLDMNDIKSTLEEEIGVVIK